MPPGTETKKTQTADGAWNDLRGQVKQHLPRAIRSTAHSIRHIAALRTMR